MHVNTTTYLRGSPYSLPLPPQSSSNPSYLVSNHGPVTDAATTTSASTSIFTFLLLPSTIPPNKTPKRHFYTEGNTEIKAVNIKKCQRGQIKKKQEQFFWKMLHEQNKKVDREYTFLIHILRHVPQ